MKKHILMRCAAAVLLGASAASVFAIPAKKGLRPYTQPDGTTIEVQLVGDEFAHMYLTADGYPLVMRDGALCYAAIASDGTVEASTFRAAAPAERGASARAFLAGVDRDLLPKALSRKAETSPLRLRPASRAARAPKGPGLFNDADFPVTGSPNVLVILAEYTDVKMSTPNAADYFTRMMTERGFKDHGGTGSALDYFDENSSGQFTPKIDVFGPVSLPHDRSYYGGNDSGGDDLRPEQMIADACRALDNVIDFAKYDNDGDGTVDNVFVFYAGMGEANGGPAESVWPHSFYVSQATTCMLDGKYIDRYACSNEWNDKRPDGVGTFVHEFSHVMGLPDLYATSYTQSFTPGSWSALDYGPYNNNGCTPPLYSAFERYALGWIEPMVIDGPANVELPAIGENKCAIIKTNDDDEFFLFENRQKTSWDTYIPGHGMLVWHVDYNPYVWANNTVNNSASHQYVDIEEADGTQNEYSRPGDAFPGTSGKTTFTDTTTPSMRTWAGIGLELPVTDITETAGTISFKVAGGATIPSPVALEAAEVSDNSFTARWEAVDGATEYFLTVSEYRPGSTSAFYTGFDNSTIPEGWTAEAAFDKLAGHYGESAPSLKLTPAKKMRTSTYGSIDGLSFKYFASNKASGKITVSAQLGRMWINAGNYAISRQSGGVTVKPNLPEGTRAFEITFQGDAGTIYIDDIRFTAVENEYVATLPAYDGVSCGSALSAYVSGLTPGTEYIYTVTCTDGELTSLPSQRIHVVPGSQSGIDSPVGDTMTVTADGNVLTVGGIAADIPVTVTDIAGRTAATAAGPASFTLAEGVYIVRAGTVSAKIMIR